MPKTTKPIEKGTLSVDTENLFPIIKKWLYSEHDIFLRELISNAYDAITKFNRLADLGKYSGNLPAPLIQIKINKKEKMLVISDNGLGMSAEEVNKYINQIAFSGAKEFLEKYKDDGSEKGGIIGHFGMGFFSSFMVADKVTIDSLSFQENAKAVHWVCEGSTSFEMGPSSRKEVGTDVILSINKENEEFLDEAKIKDLVKKYSNYLPVEIQINGQKANATQAIWQRQPSSCQEEDYKKFFNEAFPLEGDPLFWVHFTVDYPFNLKGVIFFPRSRSDFDPQKKGRLQLYCNNVFVSDNIIDIIPPYLNLLFGVIDSPDIPLNVSRSALQTDAQVRKIGQHIVNKVADKIALLAKNERETYEQYWPDIDTFIKFGCISEDKFYDKVKNALLFKNLENKYRTIAEYQEKSKGLINKVIYATDPPSQVTYIEKVKKQNVEILVLNHQIDSHFIQHLELKLAPIKFLRVDSDVSESLTGDEKDSSKEDENNQKKHKDFIEVFKKAVGKENLDIKIKGYKDSGFPAMITQSEQMRRFSDMSKLMGGNMDASGPGQFLTLILNENNEMIQKLMGLSKDEKTNKKQITELAQNIYDLSLLSHNSLKGEQLESFVKRVREMMVK